MDIKIGDRLQITEHEPQSARLAVGDVVVVTHVRTNPASFQVRVVSSTHPDAENYKSISWSLSRGFLPLSRPTVSIESCLQPNIRIKLLSGLAQMPKYAKPGDVGADLVAVSIETDEPDKIVYNLGLAIETPTQIAALLFPRSSISKYDLQLANSVGVGDPGYRGEYKAVFRKTKGVFSRVYEVGDRVCQLLLVPVTIGNFIEAQELSETERGSGGFGSTGA